MDSSNTSGRWYFISNEDAAELRAKLAGIITLIPNGPWYPEGEADRALIQKLVDALGEDEHNPTGAPCPCGGPDCADEDDDVDSA